MMKEFQEKIALITGGSSGIGLATAKLLVEAGANIWLLARRKPLLEQALKELEALRITPGQRLGFTAMDVADWEQVQAAVREVSTEIGLPDLVINSAGITEPGYLVDQGIEIIEQLMKVNYLGTVYTCKAVLPGMLERGSGTIVNVGSMLSVIGILAYTGYAGSKFAVRGFTDSLRAEMKFKGIRVHIVFPPDTETPQLEYDMATRPAILDTLFGLDKPVQAEEVAKDLLNGIKRNKYVIIPGASNKFFYWLEWISGSHRYQVLDFLINWAIKNTKHEKPGRPIGEG
jgi:3-dehydrosphinganine reductase